MESEVFVPATPYASSAADPPFAAATLSDGNTQSPVMNATPATTVAQPPAATATATTLAPLPCFGTYVPPAFDTFECVR